MEWETVENIPRILNPIDEYTNVDGKWYMFEDGSRELVEPSETYFAKMNEQNLALPEPTQEEYMMDLDYRLSVIELGL